MIRVGVFGGSGYAGGELLRYLLAHPHVELAFATSRSSAGKLLGEVLPNLAPYTELAFAAPDATSVAGIDVLFLTLEHNASQGVVPEILERRPDLKIIDLAGDFRTADVAGYERYYGVKHQAPELLDRFVYGFVEANRERIRSAQLVANPGCFATSVLLALWPLARAGRLAGPIAVTGITGSSGAGAKLAETTHHPNRAVNVRVYKALAHQHRLEIEHFLGREGWRLLFVPTSGPFVRGIFTTAIFPHVPADELGALYRAAYAAAPLVRVIAGSPELRLVVDTPLSLVGADGAEDGSVGLVAIDNLAKGAATQAIQNMNLMVGLDERTGLEHPGGYV